MSVTNDQYKARHQELAQRVEHEGPNDLGQ